MPRMSNQTKIEDTSRAVFVTMQVYPVTRETLKKVAEKRKTPLCVLVDELAVSAFKRSFPDAKDHI